MFGQEAAAPATDPNTAATGGMMEEVAPAGLASAATADFSLGEAAHKAIDWTKNWFRGLFDHGEHKDTPAAPAEDPAAKAAAEAKQDDASARAALGGKLKVVEGDGPHGPNEVSQAEFDRRVQQYNDIKRGRTDLQIDTANMKPDEAKAYQEAALGDMSKLMQTESGRAMLDHLTNDVDKDGNHIVTKIASSDRPTTKPDDKSPSAGENGRTTGSTIYYTPGKDIRLKGDDGYGGNPMDLIETGDTTLMHEMAHAYHYAKGDTATGAVNPVNPVDAQIDRSEYQASGLGEFSKDQLTENAYRAERRKLGETTVPDRPRYSPTPVFL